MIHFFIASSSPFVNTQRDVDCESDSDSDSDDQLDSEAEVEENEEPPSKRPAIQQRKQAAKRKAKTKKCARDPNGIAAMTSFVLPATANLNNGILPFLFFCMVSGLKGLRGLVFKPSNDNFL
jgi:hypothetical protein